MPQLTRITRDPTVMGGKPCIRGMRVTVGTVVGLVAAGRTKDSPVPRPVQSPSAGRIVVTPEVGGLHHRYDCVAA